MYVKEMHIEVNQSIQKIAANTTRKLLAPELDWLLNKNMGRLVYKYVTPRKDGSGGFELVQFGIDAIRSLLVTGCELPAYKADPRRVMALLPGNYSYLISDESVVKRAMYGTDGVPDQPVQRQLTSNLLLLPVPQSTLSGPPFYNGVQVYINGGLVFDIQGFAAARQGEYTGYNSKREVFYIAYCIQRELAKQGWQVYFQSYGDQYYPRTLIIDLGPLTGTASIIVDGVTTNATTASRSYIAYDYPQHPTEDQSNRLTSSDLVQNLREVAFYKTQPESPISELAGRVLYTYTNPDFIVTNTRISYVRKPQLISLSLGQDCELAPEYHQQVCDLTSEYFKAMIADPNWEVKLKDDITRTPLQ